MTCSRRCDRVSTIAPVPSPYGCTRTSRSGELGHPPPFGCPGSLGVSSFRRAPHRSRDASATPVQIDRCLQSTDSVFKDGPLPLSSRLTPHRVFSAARESSVHAFDSLRRARRALARGVVFLECSLSIPSVPLTLRRCAGCQRIAPSPSRRRETRRPSVSARVIRMSEDLRISGRPRQPRSTRYRGRESPAPPVTQSAFPHRLSITRSTTGPGCLTCPKADRAKRR